MAYEQVIHQIKNEFARAIDPQIDALEGLRRARMETRDTASKSLPQIMDDVGDLRAIGRPEAETIYRGAMSLNRLQDYGDMVYASMHSNVESQLKWIKASVEKCRGTMPGELVEKIEGIFQDYAQRLEKLRG